MALLPLNCDLGEWEHPSRTRALFRYIDLANVACGGHAGSDKTMRRCVALAAQHGVKLGAHPGLPANQGRGEESISPRELTSLLESQIGTLASIATAAGVRLAHVKLHGSLYHLTEKSSPLRRRYLETLRANWPDLQVLCLAGGRVATDCALHGLTAMPEAFLDRAYLPDGTLVPRSEPGALISSLAEIRKRLYILCGGSQIAARDGTLLSLHPKTLCVHSDSPNALALLRYCTAVRTTPM